MESRGEDKPAAPTFTRRALRYRLGGPFFVLQSDLIDIVEPYQVGAGRSSLGHHFFQHMIAHLLPDVARSVIEKEFARCWLSDWSKQLILRGINTSEGATQLASAFNKKFPRVKAAVLSLGDESRRKFDDGMEEHYLFDHQLEFVPSFGVTLNYEVMETEVLPWIRECLAHTPATLMPSIFQHRFAAYQAAIGFELNREGISISHTDCVEDTLVDLSYRHACHYYFADAIPAFTGTHVDMPRMIFEYVVPPFKSIYNSFNYSATHPFSVDFHFALELPEAKFVERYFNSIYPGTAHLHEAKVAVSGKPVPLAKVSVHTSVLFSRRHLTEFKDVLQSQPLEKIELYRKQSRTIKRTTQECVDALIVCRDKFDAFCRKPELAPDQVIALNQLNKLLKDLLRLMQEARTKPVKPPGVFLSMQSLFPLIDKKQYTVYDESLIEEITRKHCALNRDFEGNAALSKDYVAMEDQMKLLNLVSDIEELSKQNKHVEKHAESAASDKSRKVSDALLERFQRVMFNKS